MSGWGLVLPPWYSQARAAPVGWVDVLFSVIPIAPSSESCDFVVIVVPPPFLGDLHFMCDLWAQPGSLFWHSQARAAPVGWVDVLFSVIPIAPSSESCDFVVIVVPSPFISDLHFMVCPLSPAGFFFSLASIHSPLSFSVTGAVTPSVWGLMAGLSGLPATGWLPELVGTQPPYAMQLLKIDR